MTPRDVEALLVHEPFVRGLARALLRGDARVDDVVQETWLAALEGGGPKRRGAERGWLASVVRNVAYTVMRRDASRRRTETGGATPDRVPSTEAIAAKEEIRRHVLDALLQIDEPYRSALLLRYYENLPPREIAKRLEIPVETARSQVKRGLDKLRGHLDRRHGGRRSAWAVALAPFLDARSAAATGAVGALIGMLSGEVVRRTAVLAAVAGVAVVGGFVWWASRAPATNGARDAVRPVAPAPLAGIDAPVDESTAPRGARTLAGVVRGARNRAVAGALVTAFAVPRRDYFGWNHYTRVFEGFDGPPRALATARSDAAGAFRLAVPRGVAVALRAITKDAVSSDLTGLDPAADATGLVLRTEPRAAVDGVVLDGAGAPVAGATVHLLGSRDAVATTDAEGRFAVDDLTHGESVLFVRHARFATRQRRPVVAPARGLRIVLDPGRTVAGRVTTDAGGPVAGARVTIVPPQGADWGHATGATDAGGRYRIDHVGTTDPFVFALAVDGAAAGYAVRSALVWTEGETFDLVLETPRTLRARVVTEDRNGVEIPVAGVRLVVSDEPVWTFFGTAYWGPRGGRLVTTDEDGVFEAAGVNRTRALIELVRDETGWMFDPDMAPERGRVEVGETPATPLRIVERVELRGRVVDLSGRGAAGVTVEVSHGLAAGCVTTDADGRFTLRAVAPARTPAGDEVLRLRAFKPGAGAAESPKYAALPGDGIELVLEPTRVLTGQVVDEEDRPLAGVRVSSRTAAGVATTDEAGSFVFEVRRDEEPRLSFFKEGYQPAGAPHDRLTVVTLRRGLALEGVVVDARDRPVHNGFVRVYGVDGRRSRSVRTDAQGRFVVHGLGAGQATVKVWEGESIYPVQVTVTLPLDGPLRIESKPRLAVDGTVVDLEKAPLPGVHILVRHRELGGDGAWRKTYSDLKGRFHVEGLIPGAFDLMATHRSLSFEIETVEAGTRGIVVRAVPTTRVSGIVRGPNGAPVAGVRVAAMREDRPPVYPNRARHAVTDREGRFAIDRLVGASFAVWAESPEFACPVRPGVTADPVELRLETGARLAGLVRRPRGLAGDIFVSATPRDGFGAGRWNAPVDASGRFELTGLDPAASYTVTARSADRTHAGETVARAGAADILIELTKGGNR